MPIVSQTSDGKKAAANSHAVKKLSGLANKGRALNVVVRQIVRMIAHHSHLSSQPSRIFASAQMNALYSRRIARPWPIWMVYSEPKTWCILPKSHSKPIQRFVAGINGECTYRFL